MHSLITHTLGPTSRLGGEPSLWARLSYRSTCKTHMSSISSIVLWLCIYNPFTHFFRALLAKKNILLIFYIFSGARQCRIDAKLFTALVKAFFNLDMKYLWILVQKKNASLTHSRTNMYEGFPNKKDAAGLSVKLSKTVFYYFW